MLQMILTQRNKKEEKKVNISQANEIHAFLMGLPEDHPFWSEDYTKEQCFKRCITPGQKGDQTVNEWYTQQKQYHWAPHYRRDIIDNAL